MKKKVKSLLIMIGILICLQLLRIGMNSFFFLFLERTDFTDKISTMTSMILLTILFVFFQGEEVIIFQFFQRDFMHFMWYLR
ncbi:MAG: hypothetical protein PHY47_07675 [Lachnospiraceae bacterium]|nr:hypothetical protein [Lachnospiraceae bacterium]